MREDYIHVSRIRFLFQPGRVVTLLENAEVSLRLYVETVTFDIRNSSVTRNEQTRGINNQLLNLPVKYF